MRAKLNLAVAFLEHEAAAGAVLVVAAAAALLISNSPLSSLYDRILGTPAGVRIGPLALEKPLLLWINDGLMAIFFFLVGLEIKRELLRGELSTFGQAVLPAVAASGGMAAPALVYIAVTAADPATLRGWAIPAATDIAFAVGVLSLMGNRVPHSLKMFLLALAIFDDLGSLVIIAAFFTENLSWASLALASGGIVALILMNIRGVTRPAPYLLTGVYIWVCVLKSGVHATLAGVVVAFAIPLAGKGPDAPSLLEQLEESLHPSVAFGVLPVFAFANAGVALNGLALSKLFEPVALGVLLGLLLGKPLGILAATALAVASKFAAKPRDARWDQLVAVALLGGIGFTMSLFIGTLAFGDPLRAAEVRLGVLLGSLLSACLALAVLAVTPRGPRPP
jgi:Na+:H+ antiporter, NhaA family